MKLPARLSLERVVYEEEPGAELEALYEASHLLDLGLRLIGTSGESLDISWTEAADTFKLDVADRPLDRGLVETDMSSSSMWERLVGSAVEIQWDDDDERVVFVRNSEDCVYCCVYDDAEVTVTRARPDMEGCPPTREPPSADRRAARAPVPKAILRELDAIGSGFLDRSDAVAATLLVATLLTCLLASPLVWWLYGPLWAMGAAIAAPLLLALTPFNHFIQLVLLTNLLYCALAATHLLFLWS